MLVFAILLVMISLSWLIAREPLQVEAARARQTAAALALARAALIGYALRLRDLQAAQDPDSLGLDDAMMYGYLPLPDLGSSRNNNIDPNCRDASNQPLEGCDANYFTGIGFDVNGIGPSVVGRLPWRTLGLPPLRDGDGECLWLIVSGLHGRILRATPPPATPLPAMNWDTPGAFDIVVANGSGQLTSLLASAHERPLAIIFAPGAALPGQDRSRSSVDDVRQCGGNYDARNYLDPTTLSALGGVSNYLDGTNGASGIIGDSDSSNDPDPPKPLVIGGKLFRTGSTVVAEQCQGSTCALVANDRGLPLTADQLFAAIRQHGHFLGDLNSLLDRIVACLRDSVAAGHSLVKGKIAGAHDHPCYGENTHPLGYFPHWREMIFVAPNAVVNGSACAGAVLFAGQRAPGQQRLSPLEKNDPINYLEGANLSAYLSGTHVFSGDERLARSTSNGQAPQQDIVRCIPYGASFRAVPSPKLTELNLGQLASYDAATRTLTLGRENVVSSTVGAANAAALFGCAWSDGQPLGQGLRIYFNFRFKKLGSNVGFNGFVFALADAENNGPIACGAAGSHLGYSGNNGATAPVAPPKIGIEFDQSRDAGFPGAGETALNAGRNDPCGTTAAGCAGLGYNSHVAIVYWGNDTANASDGVTQPAFDDNVHGLPATLPSLRPPPRNPAYPGQGVVFKDLRGQSSQGGDSLLYHVRIEITPQRQAAVPAENAHTVFSTRVWLLADSATVSHQIAALRNTTRPMSQLVPTLEPALEDVATLYDVGVDRGSCAACQSGEACGSDGRCYRAALRLVRPGFTNAQRTTDQEVRIADFFVTTVP